jgi:hypothetical protein
MSIEIKNAFNIDHQASNAEEDLDALKIRELYAQYDAILMIIEKYLDMLNSIAAYQDANMHIHVNSGSYFERQHYIAIESMWDEEKNDIETQIHELEGKTSYHGRWLQSQRMWNKQAKSNFKDLGSQLQWLYSYPPIMHKGTGSSRTLLGYSMVGASADVLKQIEVADQNSFQEVVLKVSFPEEIHIPKDFSAYIKDASQLEFDVETKSKHAFADNSLDFEREIINKSFEDIIVNLNSPNVVCPIAGFITDANFYDISPSYYIAKTRLHKEYKNLDLDGACKTLITERGTDSLLSLFVNIRLKKIELSHKDFYAILFQVYYTLEVFSRLGIRHNDLHFGNILYRRLSVPEDLYYEVDGDDGGDKIIVHLRTRYIVKIFDMDRGSVYHKGVERNLALDSRYCQNFGECSGLYSKFDVAGFNMCLLKQMIKIDAARWTSFTFEYLMDRNCYDMYGGYPYSQLWIHQAEDDIRSTDDEAHRYVASQCLKSVKTPRECMLNLILTAVVLVVDKDSVHELKSSLSSSSYHDMSMNVVYKLPEQYRVKIGSPSMSMLADEAKDYRRLDVSSHVTSNNNNKQTITHDLGFFQDILPRVSDEKWNNMFTIWKAELIEDSLDRGLETDWATIAHNLYVLYCAKSALRPLDDVGEYALAVACLTLTCPMYYGLGRSQRERMRNGFAARLSLKQNHILSMEKVIWTAFNCQLPDMIKIPLLYNSNE